MSTSMAPDLVGDVPGLFFGVRDLPTRRVASLEDEPVPVRCDQLALVAERGNGRGEGVTIGRPFG